MILPEFVNKFKKTLTYYFTNAIFAGKDQNLFNHMFATGPEFYTVYGAEDSYHGNRWFWFFKFFNSTKKPKRFGTLKNSGDKLMLLFAALIVFTLV